MADGGLSLTVDSVKLDAALKRAPVKLGKEIQRAFKIHGALMVGKMRKRIAGRQGKAGQPALEDRLTSRSGFLRGSFKFEVTQRGGFREGDIRLNVFTTAPYARVHELGAEGSHAITPKRSAWLTIPLDAVKTASKLGGGSLRDHRVDFWLRKGANLLAMQKRGDDAIPIFVLVKRVEIRPRLGFFREWRKSLDALNRRIDDAIDRTLEGGGAA